MGLEGKSVEEIQALAELANGLSTDPKTRQGFLRLTKISNPNTVIPEVDIPDNLARMLTERDQKIDALTQKQAERELKDQILERRRTLLGKGITEAEIPQIEKIMVDKKIADYDTAIDYKKMSERSAEPTPATTSSARKFEMQKQPDLKAFNNDPKQYAYKTAYGVIDELRGRKPAA